MPFAGLSRNLRRWWEDEGGFVSAETLLSAPLLALPLLVLVDGGQVFEKHSRMWVAAHDAARGLARYVHDAAEAEQRSVAALQDFDAPVQVLIAEGDVIVVEISVTPRSESPFDIIGGSTTPLPARVIMRREPRLLDRLG